MGNKTKIVILLIVAMGIGANAQFRNNKWYFGNGCGIEFDSKGNIINNKLPSKINTEEGSASIDITDKLSLYSDGITVWDNDGNVILDKLSSNKSCTQAAMFLPRVLEGRISYVDVISLINNLKPQGASISRIFFDEQGKYSTRPNMTNVKFTKNYLLEEKMAGFYNHLFKNKVYNVLLFKAYKPLTYRDNLFLFAKIGEYRDSFAIELKENHVGDTTNINLLNSTGYVFNSIERNSGDLLFVSPEEGLIQSFEYNIYDSLYLTANQLNIKLNSNLSKYFKNTYSTYRHTDKLLFTNKSSKLYIVKNYISQSYYNLDTTIAKSIDSIDIGNLIGEKDIELGAIYSPSNNQYYLTNYASRHKFYITANEKNYLIMVDFNMNKIEKVELGGVCKYGLPYRATNSSVCSEIIDYSIFGDAEKKADTIKLNNIKNNSCGGLSFNRKFKIGDINILTTKFQVAKGNNNQIYDGSEAGADGISIVFSKDKLDKCQNAAGGLGYSGIRNAIAIELDLFKNQDNNDPDGNHLCIKVPDSSGFLTAVHNKYDIFVKTNVKIMTKNSHYGLRFSVNGSLNAVSISLDSLNNPIPSLNPDNFFQINKNIIIGDYFKKYVGSDEYYITIFGSTGDAVEEHNLYDIQLCKGYNFTSNNPTSVEEESNDSKVVLFEKTILTSEEFRRLFDNLKNELINLQIFNVNGQKFDFDESKANTLINGTLLFIRTETLKKAVYIVN